MYQEKCPYCNAEIEINHSDGYGYEEDEAYQQECPKCGKTFVYFTDVVYYHRLSKAECLNEGKHEWVASTTYPKECTYMYCKLCHEQREPTLEEWNAILGVSS